MIEEYYYEMVFIDRRELECLASAFTSLKTLNLQLSAELEGKTIFDKMGKKDE